jgi:hypothetical protein
MQETFFQGMEVVLKFRRGHGALYDDRLGRVVSNVHQKNGRPEYPGRPLVVIAMVGFRRAPV